MAATIGILVSAPVASGAATPPPSPAVTAPSLVPPGPPPTSTIGGADLLAPGILVKRPAGVPMPPALKAECWVVADARDGRVIAARGAHVRSRPASTLKTLTGLVLVDKLSANTLVKATQDDADIDGTKVGLAPGEDYSVRQLMEAMLMTSGNDAANALARAGGGMAPVAQEMTAYAHSIGARDTVAKNTSGLDADGQLTSAYDLALLGRAAIESPSLAPYLTIKTSTVPGGRTAGPRSKRQVFELGSHNKLLWNYAGTIGVKNGFTRAAGQTYIGAARRGSRTYVITYLAGQGVGWRDAAALLDWAFAYGDKVRPVGTLVRPEALTSPNPTPSAATSAAGALPVPLPQAVTSAGGAGTVAMIGAAVAAAAVLGAGAVMLVRRR